MQPQLASEGSQQPYMFDAEFYLRTNPDFAAAGLDPLGHFLASGHIELRDPAPGFSLVDYIADYPDLRSDCPNYYLDWLFVGQFEGRQPKPSRHIEPSTSGAAAGLSDPTTVIKIIAPHFDPEHYSGQAPPLPEETSNFLLHYVSTGWREGRDPTRYFSVRRYLAVNPDVAAAGVDPFAHYLTAGQAEGRVCWLPEAKSPDADRD